MRSLSLSRPNDSPQRPNRMRLRAPALACLLIAGRGRGARAQQPAPSRVERVRAALHETAVAADAVETASRTSPFTSRSGARWRTSSSSRRGHRRPSSPVHAALGVRADRRRSKGGFHSPSGELSTAGSLARSGTIAREGHGATRCAFAALDARWSARSPSTARRSRTAGLPIQVCSTLPAFR